MKAGMTLRKRTNKCPIPHFACYIPSIPWVQTLGQRFIQGNCVKEHGIIEGADEVVHLCDAMPSIFNY
jgi:hypothetical protein